MLRYMELSLSLHQEFTIGELRPIGPLPPWMAGRRGGRGERPGQIGLRPWPRLGLTQACRKERGEEKQTRLLASLGQTKKVKERNFRFYFLKT
jgi:hypothetical protein